MRLLRKTVHGEILQQISVQKNKNTLTVYTSFVLDRLRTRALKMICNLVTTEAISPNLHTVTVHYSVWLLAQ